MGQKSVLFLSANSLHAYTWKAGDLSVEQIFTDDDPGHEQFNIYLQTHRDLTYLLTDLVEEDFRLETVPHLRGRERTALIQRKLEQYYRNTPFRHATKLQQHKEGRHDDDMLFSALTNPALLTPWLTILLTQHIPLAGIYSIPGISLSLVKEISSGCLLLSWEKFAGLRQTFFNANQLHFSRLTPISENSSFVATVGVEAARTQQYLKNLSLLPPGQFLNVTIICHEHERREMESHLIDDSNMHYIYFGIQELGKHIGSKTTFNDSDATPLFMHLLATGTPSFQYATVEHSHFFKLRQLRRSLIGLGCVILTACLLVTASNLKEYRGLIFDTQTLKSQAGILLQQSEKITLSLPATQASATDMKTAVILFRNLKKSSPPPQIILQELSSALNDFPTILIEKLSWQQSTGVDSAESATLPKINSPANMAVQVILLSGELAEFTGGYRGELKTLENFQQALIQHGYTVTAITLPLDISPQGSISADTCDGIMKPAKFSLKISWRATK